MPRKRDILASIDRLAEPERAFFADETRFLAPVLPGRRVRVRIGGAVCEMKVEPKRFAGFGVFRPVTHDDALLDRETTLAERRAYLGLLRRVRLILLGPDVGGDADRCGRWLAMPAGDDRGVNVTGPLSVCLLGDGVDPLDAIVACFDGSTFWYEDRDRRASPAVAAYLRQSATTRLPAARLDRPGLSRQQREAYALCLDAASANRSVAAHLAEQLRREAQRQAPPPEPATDEQRVRDALAHGGAQLREVARRGDELRVSYDLDGHRHTSLVRARDLSVRSAGVCLAGGDRAFDLASLTGVLREGYRRHADDFW